MSYLSSEELVLPRMDDHGVPTPDNFYHTLPALAGPRSINGFMGDDYQKHVFYQIGWNTRGTAVELGAFLGLSSALFAMGMRDSPWQQGKLICIDWFQDGYLGHTNLQERWQENMKAFGVERYATAVKGSCEDPQVIPHTPLEWLYLDASHYRKELRVNMEIFYPMVKPGGLIIWHDTHMEEVMLHIDECVAEFGITPVITNRPDFEVWMKPMEFVFSQPKVKITKSMQVPAKHANKAKVEKAAEPEPKPKKTTAVRPPLAKKVAAENLDPWEVCSEGMKKY